MKKIDEFLLTIKQLGVKVGNESSKYTPYLAIPSIDNIKWLMPLVEKGMKKNSFLLYQANTAKGKMLKNIYQNIPNGVIQNLFYKNIIYLNTDGFLYDLNKDNIKYNYSFFLGTEGSDCKMTIQVSNESHPVMYLKITNKSNVKKLFYNENKILSNLKNTLINNKCPNVVINQEYKGWNIFASSTTKNVKSTFRDKLTKKHVDFLVELYISTKGELISNNSGYFTDSMYRISKYLEKNKDDLWILEYFSNAVGYLQTKGISTCTSHRDFTMWNCYFNDNDIFVFDWEYSSQISLPFFDILHFIIQPAILNNINEENIYKEITASSMIQSYSKEINISIENLNYFIILYLIDIILLYDSKIETYTKDDISVRNNRIKLLKYTLRKII